ncbi:MAG: 2Fe-2S iron-sulfur cluster-binding protein [Leptolyngbyaceae cyanobacterium MO_188.B28]|nr:2Fe-2S iron-sulfur cluster-binding protein [Leptolyngbyaceae cyanobacterium MO_188.B28]
MPKVTAQGKTFECDRGANLRRALLKNNVCLYNQQATLINCRGIGSCGTCAVAIEGEVSEANWRDRTRRALPPHSAQRDLRLACQTKVLGDIKVTKFDGFWGQGSNPVGTSHEAEPKP